MFCVWRLGNVYFVGPVSCLYLLGSATIVCVLFLYMWAFFFLYGTWRKVVAKIGWVPKKVIKALGLLPVCRFVLKKTVKEICHACWASTPSFTEIAHLLFLYLFYAASFFFLWKR